MALDQAAERETSEMMPSSCLRKDTEDQEALDHLCHRKRKNKLRLLPESTVDNTQGLAKTP